MVTWVFYKLEIVVFLGLWSLTAGLAPETNLPNIMDLIDGADFPQEMPLGYAWYMNIVYLFAITAIEPFFVGAGFGLYLNSRTLLEGWDVELTFRRLAARLQPLLVLLFMGLMTFSVTAAPQPVPQEAKSTEVTTKAEIDPAKKAAKKILEQPEFKIHSRTQKVWVSDSDDDDRDSGEVSPLIALLLQGLLWLIVAALIAFVIYLLVVNRHLLTKGFRVSQGTLPKIQGPRVIMGMDIARESLPADIVTAARSAWLAGHYRVALSLLYRGSLSRLMEQQHLPIRDSDTEDDCLDHLLKVRPKGQETDYFTQLTQLWTRAAYAGQEANQSDFEQLCAAWPFDVLPQVASASRKLLVILPLLLIVGCNGKWEDVEKKTGYKGKARTEYFLASELLLEEYGYDVEHPALLDRLPEDSSSVMLLSAENAISGLRAKEVLQWVEGGGHVIYVMAGCTPYNDWGMFSSMTGYGYFGNDARPDAMLKELKVEVTDRRTESLNELTKKGKKKTKDSKKKVEDKPKVKAESEVKSEPETAEKTEEPKVKTKKPEIKKPRIQDPEDVSTKTSKFAWDGDEYEVELPDFVSFKLERDLGKSEFLAGTTDKALILGLRHGLGRITLMNHARPFRNRYLGDHDHASWLIALMGEDALDVWFISGMEKSFMSLLWDHAWMVILTLSEVLIFWLWCHVPRFGPMRQVALHETKHFVDHIGALGHFFHRLKRDDVLLFDSAHQVRAKALIRFPQLHGAGDDVLLPRLAEVSGLPIERIQSALMPPAKPAPFQLVALLKDLQTLRQSL
jgi:hypothetical protein